MNITNCHNRIRFFPVVAGIFMVLLATCGVRVLGQSTVDTEFPEGFILYGRLHSGMVTNFHSSPDLFVGGIQVVPQVAVVPHLLRAGVVAGTFFTNSKMQGEFGPLVAVKLKTFFVNLQGTRAGSLGNLQLQLDHLWGTGRQRLMGGGIIFDAGNLITAGMTGHRDYRLKTWWFHTQIGVRISKKKKNPVI